MEPTLLEILDARERRAQKQKALLSQYQKPLLCFTMNIPGPVKLDKDISIGFYVGLRLLDDALRGCRVLHREKLLENTGCEAYLVVDLPERELKQLAIDLEETPMIGRLFDMDVLAPDGQKLTREEMGFEKRRCLLCDNDAVVCARARAHSLEQLTDRVGFLLFVAAKQELCEYIAVQAYLALQQEVSTTPKPGLVDRNNRGAHKDMDIRHFFVSANTLRPYFCQCAQVGFLTREDAPAQTLAKLRPIGMEAEAAMFKATGGVNTHKGAIFSLGLLCAAAGRLDPFTWSPETLTAQCAAMTQGITARELGGITRESAKTAGEKLYAEHGITGIRGQAEAGFPAVVQVGLPILRRGLAQGKGMNDSCAGALLHLMATTEDTNLIHRGGWQTQKQLQARLQDMLAETPFPATEVIEALDQEFIEKNLSPGGCADLLALCCFLQFLCK